MHKSVIIYLILLLMGTVSGWGPNSHLYIIDRAMEKCSADPECNTSIIYKTITENVDAYRCGFMYPDVSVIYYYTNFKTYEVTHSWGFCDKALEYAKTPDEKAAAYGCFSHLVADSITHNYFIPSIIDQTHIPNDIIHPLTEGLVETNYIDNIRTPHSMDLVDLYIPLFNRAAGTDLTNEAYTLKTAIGGQSFYNTLYTIPEDSWILKVWKFIGSSVVDSGIIETDIGGGYIDKSIESTYRYYKTGTYQPLDPAGTRRLDISGSRIRMTVYAYFFVAALMTMMGMFLVKKFGVMKKIKKIRK